MKRERTWYPLTGSVPGTPLAQGRVGPGPVDPLTGPPLALAGRVVTMNDTFVVRDDAVVYIEKGTIAAVQDRAQPAPPGFAGAPLVDTGGTIFPGLIELHNHLSYNALPLWSPVPKRFTHRGEWPNHKDYRPLVSGPMTVLGQYQDDNGQFPLLPPLVRYIESKCLLGGVTTSQGVRLSSNAGIQRYYRGIVRNVEQTNDPALPEAQGRIPDLEAKDAKSFLARLKKVRSCFLLHLSEGLTDPNEPLSVARKHFLTLEVAPGEWALNKVFTGIHSAGLLPEDFRVMAQHDSSIVWSPLSNLLLYGDTARVAAAREAGVRIGLGSDWSPTGSKNLFGELKVAWLHSQHALDGLFSARDIVAMATCEAARILKWQEVVGSLEAGKLADLFVIEGTTGDAYDALIRAKETDIHLVMINGIARYGLTKIMQVLSPGSEPVRVGHSNRQIFFEQETSDPDVAQVSLAEARTRLEKALHDIATLAKEIETPKPERRQAPLDANARPAWTIALDEITDCGVEFAPRLPLDAPNDVSGADRFPAPLSRAAPPLSTVLNPVKLDPLTVADDGTFLDRIAQQPNVPDAVRNRLSDLL
jgi:5-methylthioadenosine/S-adenosylhomocysteine deaminase